MTGEELERMKSGYKNVILHIGPLAESGEGFYCETKTAAAAMLTAAKDVLKLVSECLRLRMETLSGEETA